MKVIAGAVATLAMVAAAAAGSATPGWATPGRATHRSATHPGDAPPRFVESRIDAGSEKFEHQFVDADGDGRIDLLVTAWEAGARTLRLYRLRDDAQYPAQPDFRMSVPPDVVAFSLMDVRPEPGKEILLLTRTGVFSLTTTKENLQGNLRRELALPLFPDLPDPESLPCWRMILDVDGDGRDELMVVSEGNLLALAAVANAPGAPAGTPALRALFSVPCRVSDVSTRASRVSLGSAGISVSSREGLASFFPGERTSRPVFSSERLLQCESGFDVPALFDWDGDKRRDIVSLEVDDVRVRVQDAPNHFEDAERVIPLPQSLRAESGDRGGRRRHGRLKLQDLDGDGSTELVLTRSEGRGSGQEHSFIALRRHAGGAPDEAPSAIVKLEGMDVDYETVDVDHDGRMDLVAKRVDVPTGLTSLANIRLDTCLYLFHGQPGATFDRDPAVKLERTFRPDQLARVQETLLTDFGGDFDGDGLNDLVLTQIDGRLEIRRLAREDNVFSFVARPIASFTPSAPVERMETWDLSMDGVADLVLRHKRSFTLFVSRKEAAK